jgi:hypothetical protein
MSAFSQDNLQEFGSTFERYWKLTGKSRADSLAHAAKNFGYFARRRLMEAALPKGAITSERLSALKGGSGITISHRAREIVYKKYGVRFARPSGINPASPNQGPKGSLYYMVGAADRKRGLTKKQQDKSTRGGITLQALLAQQEIKLREGHRMFTASSMVFKGPMTSATFSTTKASRQLGRARPARVSSDADSFEFEWGQSVGKWSGIAAVGLNTPSRRAVMDPALDATRKDMIVYIQRKHDQAAKQAASKLR